MNEPLLNLLERAVALQRLGRRVVACLVVKARGSTPQSAGALMLVDEDFNTFGTIGGGCVEAEVRRQAHEMLTRARSGVVRFKLDHDYGWDDGLICGGTIEMAIAPLPPTHTLERVLEDVRTRRATSLTFEVTDSGTDEVNSAAGQINSGAGLRDCPEQAQAHASPWRTFSLDLPPRDRLYIAGAGHVGQALARLAIPLEFETTIFDDREDLLQKFAPPGCLPVAGDIAEQLRSAPIDERTYIVIVTRGHKHDEQALHAAIGGGATLRVESHDAERRATAPVPKYLGMIGSRRKIKLIFDDLKDMGVDPKLLASVHAPIGLDIGSVSVEEIALSIAAELVQVRRSDHRSPVRCETLSDSSSVNSERCEIALGQTGSEA